MEYKLNLSDIDSIIASLRGRKSGCEAAILLHYGESGSNEEEIIKSISNVYSLLYDFADQFIIDISHQNFDYADDIIDTLVGIRLCYDTYKPLLVHIPEGISEDYVDDILKSCRMSGIDGVITQNFKIALEKVGSRYPVYAELQYANPEIVSKALINGADAVLVHSYKPGCHFTKKCLKACVELSKKKI
ncbi:MAG: hypothetical protein MJY80_02685 [Bacteroidales bacterium]|nr:hypothetical protein [Bacteroidales bacterium]